MIPSPEFLMVAIACGTGCGVAFYMAGRHASVTKDYAFIVTEVVREYEPDEGTMDGSTFEQLDMIDAMNQRNAVLDDLADRNAGWLQRAAELMRKVPPNTIGLGEDFRRMLLEQGLDEPRSHKSWGPLTLYLVKQGMLVPTGEWKPMRSAKSNGRASREYRRVDPQERAA